MKENNATATSSTYTATDFLSSCKYKLPCGICDRTGGFCTNYPYYPSWKYVTCAQGTSIDAGHIKTGTITANTEANL